MLLLFGCNAGQEQQPDTAQPQTWEEVLANAKGQTVTFMMWQGDPFINQYMANHVKPAVKEQYGVDLQIVPGQGNEIVSLTMAELEAGKAESQVDMCWINGETFFQLQQIEALHGPFVEQLPNSQFIDWSNPFIHTDFQRPVNGMECPWGNVQLALIYDSARVASPPRTVDEISTFVKAHPGKFTIPNDFTGMTLLKSLLTHFAGGKESLNGAWDEAKYQTASTKMWEWINSIKKDFWNKGQSFPADVSQMHQLFASGELWVTMSNNDGEVDNKILQGLFPQTARAWVPDFGTIQNSHYLGVLKLSAHKEAAMVVINHMISPEAQWKKLHPDVWGDGTILDRSKLPADWQEKFAQVPGRTYSPPRTAIQPLAIMEPAPEYMIHLFEDFRKQVMEK